MSDLNDKLKDRLDKGVNVSISVDIRKVENFFKKLFGIKEKPEEKKDERRKKNKRSNSRRNKR